MPRQVNAIFNKGIKQMAKDEIKEVTGYAFAGTIWPTRADAEAKMAEMDFKEWVRSRFSSHDMYDAEDMIGWLTTHRQKLVEMLSKIK